MKIAINSAVVVIGFFLLTISSHGQCLSLQAVDVSCTGPNNCSQTVAVNQTYNTQYGFYTGRFPVYCCDTSFDSATEESGCDGDIVRSQIPKQALAAEAELQPLLIRSCGGLYNPYVDQPTKAFDIERSLSAHVKLALN